jgi:SAM-dependent methyltransferase
MLRSSLSRLLLRSDAIFGAYLRYVRGGGTVVRPTLALPPTGVLKNSAQKDAIVAEVRRLGLPPRKDSPKNWEALTALGQILETVPPDGAVLDAGGDLNSVILPWLFLYGYRDLHAIDLIFSNPLQRGPIRYHPGDLTRTPFPDGRFDAITCLSVIEHGVDPHAYFKEMYRLLKPGGLLVTTCDYWQDAIDTVGRLAYGTPIRVFTPEDIRRVIQTGEQYGFQLRGSIELACEEKVVTWVAHGLSYTFLAFSMTKTA